MSHCDIRLPTHQWDQLRLHGKSTAGAAAAAIQLCIQLRKLQLFLESKLQLEYEKLLPSASIDET
jgi:hypothetical protein